jgi:DNA-binding response OmpR family regulator
MLVVLLIMLTALGGQIARFNGLAVGAMDFMRKPFSPRDLLQRVGSLLRKSSEAVKNGAPAPARYPFSSSPARALALASLGNSDDILSIAKV